LVAAHGSFASGISQSVRLLVGDFEHIRYLDAYLNPEEDFPKIISSYFADLAEDDTIVILTDLKSGSVTQVVLPYIVKETVYLIAGFNLPLLLAVVLDDGKMSKDKLLSMIEDSKSQMELIDPKEQSYEEVGGLWKDT
jgi:mannose/fructose-specific phosphotransferase system component IIA